MNLTDLWAALGMVSAASALLGAGATTLLRAAMTRDFVRKPDVQEIAQRVSSLHERVLGVPTHGDLGAMAVRLGEVEATVAATDATIRGLSEGMRRIEHMVDLLVKQQLGVQR